MLVLANIFQPIINIFEQVLLFFHDQVGLGWGLSIIAMTIAVRAVLFPLTYKQIKSMRALQQLTPEMKALQAKYKDDKQRLNQELMKFYADNKVNPLASCLPIVAQIPVFISLFYMLRKDLKEDICGPALRAAHLTSKEIVKTGCDKVDPGSAQFWFINDLTFKATGATLAVLLVLYVGSQLLSSILSTATMDKNQRFLLLGLPFMFVFLILSFPAGLLVYWITTNLWTVGQGVAVRRKFPNPPKPEEGETPAKPAAAAKSAGSAKSSVVAAVTGGAAPPPPPRKKKKRSGKRR